MLAVLPFKNMGAPGDQYFADGLTEEITSRLAGVSDLGVVSRTSTDPYKGTSKGIRQIGQELGVGYILEGSVRWEKSPGEGSRVRVTPQLIRVADDRHLWTNRYDAELADVFQVQSSIAERVTSAMNLALDPSEKRTINERPTANTAAYDFYLRGIEYRSRGPGQEDIHNSIEMFRRAIALDSNFAQAWARLSEGRSSEYWFFYDRTEAALSEAKAAAERALRLRPDLAEPHVALGYYYYWGELNYDRALQELALARERQPNNADLVFATAAVQRRQGRWPESVANFERAVQLDPRSSESIRNLAETYYLVRKYDLACATADRGISIGPDIAPLRWMKVQCLVGKDDLPQAKQALRDGVKAVDFVQMSRPAAGSWRGGQLCGVAELSAHRRLDVLLQARTADAHGVHRHYRPLRAQGGHVSHPGSSQDGTGVPRLGAHQAGIHGEGSPRRSQLPCTTRLDVRAFGTKRRRRYGKVRPLRSCCR